MLLPTSVSNDASKQWNCLIMLLLQYMYLYRMRFLTDLNSIVLANSHVSSACTGNEYDHFCVMFETNLVELNDILPQFVNGYFHKYDIIRF